MEAKVPEPPRFPGAFDYVQILAAKEISMTRRSFLFLKPASLLTAAWLVSRVLLGQERCRAHREKRVRRTRTFEPWYEDLLRDDPRPSLLRVSTPKPQNPKTPKPRICNVYIKLSTSKKWLLHEG